MQTDRKPSPKAAVDAYRAGLADDTENKPSYRDLEAQTGIPKSTIFNRVKTGAVDHKTAAAHLQAMTPQEELSLVDYIRRMSLIGHPPTHDETREIANYLRRSRLSTTPVEITPTSSLSSSVPLLGKNWIDKFRGRHPSVVSAWTRALDTARIDGDTPEKLVAWFAELRDLYHRHGYAPENMYNMDETGFAIGSAQSTRVLTVFEIRKTARASKADHRGEWTTSIECVSAAGGVLPPLVILKGKGNFNEAWLPAVHRPLVEGWQFRTSNKGWSNDFLALEWLQHVFIPSTTPRLQTRGGTRPRRLLIVDGHGSHVRSSFIGLCIKNDIDLMILPAHTSHKTQPLDKGVFGPLKRAMGRETDRVATYHKGAISKAIYTSLLVAARSQAMTADNIKAGWRGTGLWPLRPSVLIGDIDEPATPAPAALQTARTPLGSIMAENRAFIRDHADTLRTPAKHHITTLADRLEAADAEIALLKRRLAGYEELQAAKKPRRAPTTAYVRRHLFTDPDAYDTIVGIETEGAARSNRQVASGPSRITQDDAEGSLEPSPFLVSM